MHIIQLIEYSGYNTKIRAYDAYNTIHRIQCIEYNA